MAKEGDSADGGSEPPEGAYPVRGDADLEQTATERRDDTHYWSLDRCRNHYYIVGSDTVPNLINSPKIAVIGEKSAQFSAQLGISPTALEESDLAIFLVSANSGIVSADLDQWRLARELYIPSLVAISDLTTSDIDFDDMSAIASKMLDPVVTPYLVLHDDSGKPAALINLETLNIHDYSKTPPEIRAADPEHIEVVSEFQAEYLEAVEAAGDQSFQAGLLFPALPWIESSAMGMDQIKELIDQIPSGS